MKSKIVWTAEEQEREKQSWLVTGEKIATQKVCDFVSIVLNDPEVMGKNAMSGEKIDRILTAALQMADKYHLAFTPRHVESDVWQERLDAFQKKIFKEKFVPFNKRYPAIRRIKY